MEARELVALARKVLPLAYAPYSRYPVAAALVTAEGEVFTGVNVENGSFGLTICAERNAVAAAVSAGRRRFSRLAVVAQGDLPPLPCGACRQVLAEFAPHLQIFVAAGEAAVQEYSLQELLPHAFNFGAK